MSSTNPVLKNLPGAEVQNSRGGQPYQPGYEYGYDQYGAPMGQPVSRPMTIDDVTAKTGITLAVIIAAAVVSFGLWGAGVQPLAAVLTFGGAIAAFITVLVHSFGKKFGSPTITLLYAVFEGLFLGGFSFAVSGAFSVGGADAGMMIGQAILGTIGVFIGMLVVYRTGAIRVTPRFNRILTGVIFGAFIMALGNFLLYLFTGLSPLRGGGTMSILFGVFCVVLAALAFLQDFDLADKLVRTNAPQEAAWGVALGLAVTLVWLYTEILRLLSLLSDR
ncbi:Bax inhibitor-1/YccA family protein [Corynebacterium aquatimens]|uniref:Bax inhibitor-1/YccA family protein n=1 Tax=Corynebacterium TaxID=1716 RepID=UPI001F2D624E|nr:MULTISPECIES: Bax inhibitor-1/YccA family protein [Corynebacterium]QYH20004.1 Bax inhibitor-1/YccA family protein [Corynebacterium aquatimens]UIZ92805.1 Bax inhibitor-1/YccA family protein [Corynebacterium sp. CNCTC7651]